MQQPILTVTVNPALDLTTTVPRLAPHRKLRCAAAHYDPGGGGVNVSRVIAALGGTSKALVAIGGSTGGHLSSLLAERGVDAVYWPIAGETRTSFTVTEDETGEHYRFVLPGPVQPPGSLEALLAAVADAMPPDCRYVVLSGSLLPGLPTDAYAALIDLVRARGAVSVLDAHGAELRLALAARPDILRLNHLEAGELLDRSGTTDSAAELCHALRDAGLADTVLVSHAEDGTAVCSRAGAFEVRPPPVEEHSALGAGDSFVGGLVLGLARGWSLLDATRYGVAAAAAAVTTDGASLCDRPTTEALFERTLATTLDPARATTPA